MLVRRRGIQHEYELVYDAGEKSDGSDDDPERHTRHLNGLLDVRELNEAHASIARGCMPRFSPTAPAFVPDFCPRLQRFKRSVNLSVRSDCDLIKRACASDSRWLAAITALISWRYFARTVSSRNSRLTGGPLSTT